MHLAGLVDVELPVQARLSFEMGLQHAVDPAGRSAAGLLVGVVPGDVVNGDTNPDRAWFPADIEVLGPRLVEQRGHVEAGQTDLFVMVGDAGGKLMLVRTTSPSG
jgi:hypothetical protein